MNRRRRTRSRTPEQTGIVSGLLAALIVVSPQLFGGSFAWTTAAIAGLAFAAAAVAVWETRGVRPRRADGVEPVAILLLLLLLITIATAFPLPASMVAWLAPDTASHARATAKALGAAEPAWMSLSPDPGRTYERVLYAAAVLAAFCAARVQATYRRSRPVFFAVALSALLAAVVSLVHLGLGAREVFGLYAPRYVTPPLLGPLVNPNNLASFLVLGLPVLLGFTCAEDQHPALRRGAIGALCVVFATILITHSRAAVLATGVGTLSFLALYLLRQRAGAPETKPRARMTRAVALAATALVLGAALTKWAVRDLVDPNYADVSKLEFFREIIGFVLAEPGRIVHGVGRGAFGATFAQSYDHAARGLYAESLPLQYATEFGVPLTILAALMLGLGMLRAFRIQRSPVQLGAICGVLAFTVHNLADFAVELTGIAVVAAACLAAALPQASASTSSRWATWFNSRGLAVAASAGCLLSLVFAAPAAVAGDLWKIERKLEAELSDANGNAFRNVLAEGAPLHPAEASVAVLAAARAVMDNEPNASLWLNRAMLLAPGWPSPHRWAAIWLARRGNWDQALGELHEAAERDPVGTGDALCTILAQRPLAQIALSVAPDRGPARASLLDKGAICLFRAPQEAEKVDAELLALDPQHLEARTREVKRLIARGNEQEAFAAAEQLRKLAPHHAATYQVIAQCWMLAGQPQEAVRVLLEVMPRLSERAKLLEVLARAQAAVGNAEAMRTTLDEIRANAAGDANGLANAMIMLARIEQGMRNDAHSLKAWREAYALRPDEASLAGAAAAAERLGEVGYAAKAWNELCARYPTRTNYCAARDRLHSAR